VEFLLCRDSSRFLPKLNEVEQQTCLRRWRRGGVYFDSGVKFLLFPFSFLPFYLAGCEGGAISIHHRQTVVS
jgi:hypothetical protein